ncbi:translesion DNA synthesis-associated protein ImuA [Ferrimonas sediminicola]|nr:translesion DNA synthesis-associated protein ImuA [Ferrimonas sediminicola]
MLKPVDSLLKRDDLWLASQWQQEPCGIATGFPGLDRHLARQGWPNCGVVEVLVADPGSGEVLLLQSLMTPAQDQWLLLICPPFVPYAPAWSRKLDLSRLLCLTELDRKEQLWAAEQALASGSCQRVLLWLDALSVSESRRLQLAAERGDSVALVFLPLALEQQSHPVGLRLRLTPEPAGHRLQILKQRGGWPQSPQRLPLAPQGWGALPARDAATLVQGPW